MKICLARTCLWHAFDRLPMVSWAFWALKLCQLLQSDVAIAHNLLKLLGAASEGAYWYSYLPTMRDEWFDRLMADYENIVREHRFLVEILKFEPPLQQEKMSEW